MPTRPLAVLLAAPILAAPILVACVTTGNSPVGAAFTDHCAPPRVEARFTDPDGLPALYDDALRAYVPDGPRAGAAQRFVTDSISDGLTAALAGRFAGTADCGLDVAVENVILPDRTRYTPLSGQKSYLVRAVLTDADGTVLAETARPFTVLAEHQKRGRLGGSAWRRIGRTADLRAEALDLLNAATVQIIGDAFSGGRTQTGMAGKLAAYPDRLPG